ncbi:hypothetical protein DM02DRAFT_657239 [Periconia macrospinosa]|uniref:Uncharacterized protein n=1 Tax=Periconia macrospinosa TaxID=97972 RepID=A0A2V1DMQ3_9PLEO|nr:hypothetical protein DM02DRAFT_657239 [Periconia macrospinosa]
MKGFSTVIFASLLSQGVLAANPKLNQYRSVEDCKKDKNIISHSSPSMNDCRAIDTNTRAVYLVIGGGSAGQHFYKPGQAGRLQTGTCLEMTGPGEICKVLG